MTDPDLLTATQASGVLTLTLGNGRAHALSLALIDALHQAVRAAATDPEVRVIVIDGPGTIFCAGHDLKEIDRHRSDADGGAAYLTRLFEACAQLMIALSQSPKPTLARVAGIATAAGLQLVAACDLAYASEEARFCLPGVRNGGFCTTPAVAVSRAVGRKALMDLLLNGENRDAAWALRSGLLTDVVPAADLLARTEAVALRLAARNPRAITAGKTTTLAQQSEDLSTAYAMATPTMIGHFLDPERRAFENTRFSSAD